MDNVGSNKQYKQSKQCYSLCGVATSISDGILFINLIFILSFFWLSQTRLIDIDEHSPDERPLFGLDLKSGNLQSKYLVNSFFFQLQWLPSQKPRKIINFNKGFKDFRPSPVPLLTCCWQPQHKHVSWENLTRSNPNSRVMAKMVSFERSCFYWTYVAIINQLCQTFCFVFFTWKAKVSLKTGERHFFTVRVLQ